MKGDAERETSPADLGHDRFRGYGQLHGPGFCYLAGNPQSPLVVETIDGQLLALGPVTWAVDKLQLQVGTHSEEAEFYLASALHFPIVLGLEWLEAHDPHISWSQRTISFGVPGCMGHVCLALAAGMEKDGLADLPAKYAGFADVFSETEADLLPLH